jgi:hypothetical protein
LDLASEVGRLRRENDRLRLGRHNKSRADTRICGQFTSPASAHIAAIAAYQEQRASADRKMSRLPDNSRSTSAT